MARPQKEGLDYFPLDIELDDKVKLIDAKFGVTGFGVLIKIWQIIYDNGYFILWTEKELLLYKTRINADINLINDVINECLKWDIFNSRLYDAYSILTSKGIQKRFFEATKRRTEISLANEYILTSFPENYKPVIKILPVVNAYNNSKNVDSSTQRKEKKSKVKKSKVLNTFTSESIEFKYAVALKELILKNNPSAKVPDEDHLQNWAKGFDLILRVDKRILDEDFYSVLRFSQQDNFWKANILSPNSFREHYDKLKLKWIDWENKLK